MYDGIIDYLEIMHLAGVSELKASSRGNSSIVSLPISGTEEKVANANPKPPVKPVKIEPAPAEPVTSEPLRTITLPNVSMTKAEQLQWFADETAKCTRCKELAASRTQTVFGAGNPDAALVFLGEAPGADEDKQGVPFVGRAGQLLTDIITKGMKFRREDVYICNVLRCRPPGNRNPLPDEAAHCRPFLDRTLEVIKPKFICCLGAVAAKNLLATEQTIGSLRGKIFDYNGIKVVCTYHPAYLLRNPSAKKETWNDIQMLMREMGSPSMEPDQSESDISAERR